MEEKVKPTQILKEQHRKVKALFKKIEKATGAGQRRTLLDQLAADLKLHMQIEENVFYPAAKELETKKAEGMVLEAYEEHAVVKRLLAELPKVDPNDERIPRQISGAVGELERQALIRRSRAERVSDAILKFPFCCHRQRFGAGKHPLGLTNPTARGQPSRNNLREPSSIHRGSGDVASLFGAPKQLTSREPS